MNCISHFIKKTGIMLVLVAGSFNAYAVSLSFAGPDNVTLGDSFSVELIASNFDTADLAGFSIDVAFDDSLLSFTGYSLGTELIDPLFGQQDLSLGEYLPGLVNVGEVSWLLDFALQPDSFNIATLNFDALSVGTALLAYDFVDLTDPDALPLSADRSAPLSVEVATPVPLPASLWLFVSGLLGMAGVRRGCGNYE